MKNFEQQPSRLEEAKGVIARAAERIEEEFKRTKNTWPECFGSSLFALETYLDSEKVKNELGAEKFNAVLEKLEALKQRLADLKQQYPDKGAPPPKEIKQELLSMLDVLK